MSEAEELFKSAPEPENVEHGEIPDGKYLAELTHVDRKTSGAGNDMLALRMVVSQGEHEGHVQWLNLLLETEDNMSWFKRAMKSIGCLRETLAGTIVAAENTIGYTVKMRLKSKDEWQNCYLASVADDAQPSGNPDDYPF